uniref:Zinc finger protein 711 n=1 Tax=Pan troglodytes TaxID=9598 RepID=G2HHI8_PANTR|nr:zinc finger protein 711 [Pan troglodytes]
MLCYSKQTHFYAILEMGRGNKMWSFISHLVIEPFILYLEVRFQK